MYPDRSIQKKTQHASMQTHTHTSCKHIGNLALKTLYSCPVAQMISSQPNSNNKVAYCFALRCEDD